MRKPLKCPNCASQSVKFKYYLFDDYNLSLNKSVAIYKCKECALTFSDLSLSYEDSYDSDYYIFRENRKSADIAFANHCCQWLTDKVSVHGKKLLDIGCARGFFCECVSKAGALVTGLEPSLLVAEETRRRTGLNIITGFFENTDLEKNYYDVLTMWDVLEHFSDPNLCLQKANEILKKDGLLAISVPNHSSIFAFIAGSFWKGYNLYHVSHFSPKILVNLLKQNGFTVIPLETQENNLFSREGLFRLGIKDRIKAFLIKLPLGKKVLMNRRGNPLLIKEIFTGHNDYIKTSNRNIILKLLEQLIKRLKLGDQIRILAIKSIDKRN